jgi:hypothetical protein
MNEREKNHETEIGLVTMIQELLLNFGVSKRELCNYAQMSVHKLNRVLQNADTVSIISNEQARKIKNYYYAMIQQSLGESLYKLHTHL